MGSRGTKTGLRLWEKVKEIETGFYCTDYWKSDTEFVPEDKHVQTQSETYTIESHNSRVWHYLTRFSERQNATQKMYMIGYSLGLLFLKLNNELSILSY